MNALQAAPLASSLKIGYLPTHGVSKRGVLVIAVALLFGYCALFVKDAAAQSTDETQTQHLLAIVGPLYAFEMIDIISSFPATYQATPASHVSNAGSDVESYAREMDDSDWLFFGQGHSAFVEREVSTATSGKIDYDIEAQSYYVGADYTRSRGDASFGLLFASQRSEGERRLGATQTDSNINFNSLIPYVNIRFRTLDVWALMGSGLGDIAYSGQAGGKTDTDIQITAFGIKNQILSLPQFNLGMKIGLNMVRLSTVSTKVAANRAHLVIVADYHCVPALYQVLKTYAELGGRMDYGDDSVDTGSALNIKFGATYHHLKSRIGIGVEGRWQVDEQDGSSNLLSWGTGAKFYMRPDALGRGLSLAWRPRLIIDSDAVPALRHTATTLLTGEGSSPPQLSLGYSWWVPSAGLFLAYTEFDVNLGTSDRLRLGLRLQPRGTSIPLQWSMYSDYREDNGTSRNELGLTAKLGF